jgi:predicted ATP-grasp superfamily ATP-dependent carboligase
MSALFLADGERACRVGLSRQDIRQVGEAPFVYHGAIGPRQDATLAAEVDRALALLVPAFGLRGLASADFIATPQGPCWLEVNPRPSATMVLYDGLLPRGLVHAHVQACAGRLPEMSRHVVELRGHCIVHAEVPIAVDQTLSDALADRPHTHDLPQPGARVGAGEPLCSVSARAASEAEVRAALDQSRRDVLALAARPARDTFNTIQPVPCTP